ncbi:MAG TPA: GNAT family N-acetyltransferase [Sporichthya sp.]|nr:GNAT family N-acetyltransferase [Sporichthya sp.]
MALEIRALTAEDDAASWELGRLAFGGPRERPAGRRPTPAPGAHALGAFDGNRLIGKAVDLEHTYYYGGRAVPGSGVAGVAIAPEARGGGLLGDLLGPLMAQARDRGAVVSALFPTTAVPYRRLGWELTGVLRWTSLPTAALTGERRPTGMRVRPAEEADVPAIVECYRSWAAEGTGMLGRTGPLFGREPLRSWQDGYSVALGPEGVEGYASWDREGGYDAGGVLAVPDLVATTPRALTTLLAMLATWRSVAPTLHLRLRPDDPTWLLTGLAGARTLSEQPWMLRLIDAPAAIAARGWPAGLDGSVDLDLVDELCPWNAGPHQLTLKAGVGSLAPGGAGTVRVEPGGLAVLYAGAAGPATLRRANLLSGGDADTDAFLTAAGAGPPPAMLDYF